MEYKINNVSIKCTVCGCSEMEQPVDDAIFESCWDKFGVHCKGKTFICKECGHVEFFVDKSNNADSKQDLTGLVQG